MAFLLKYSKNLLPINNISNQLRTLSIFPRLQLKEIKTVEDGKNITISGEIRASERLPYLLPNNNPNVCSLCASGLDVKHTDILILSQFVRNDGCMLPRRITKLCKTQHKRMYYLVSMAKKAGLMPNLSQPNSKKDPRSRYQWRGCNKYFDEQTIKWRMK